MGRPTTVSIEQILEAARELFLAEGFAVTTAAIARRAGISEGSIFKRFPTKEELFFAAMGIPEPQWIDGLSERAGQGEVRATMIAILLDVMAFFQDLMPRIMMIWSCRAMAPETTITYLSQEGSTPMRSLRALSDYFVREESLGRLRPGRAGFAARLFLASADHYAFAVMTNNFVDGPLSATDFATGVVDLLLQGLAPAK